MPDGPGAPPTQSWVRRALGPTRSRTLYGAIDLGTNNCRLLVAEPSQGGFRVVDAFSRIVRLGEGLGASGRLSDAAMTRTMDAVAICAEKLKRKGVTRIRSVATQACRIASNGGDFLSRVRATTGLRFDIITPKEEARLAVLGCAGLVASDAPAALVVDIGGGSTELSWVTPDRYPDGRVRTPRIQAWTSLPIGVVTLAERFPEEGDRAEWYQGMVDHVRQAVDSFADAERLRALFSHKNAHMIGTSGTVTSLAGVHLGLPRYRRDVVDSMWIGRDETLAVIRRLSVLDPAGRALEPCIGNERADLVLAGAAILEAIMHAWPSDRLRVADRGLREGLLLTLMAQNRNRRRNSGRHREPAPANSSRKAVTQ